MCRAPLEPKPEGNEASPMLLPGEQQGQGHECGDVYGMLKERQGGRCDQTEGNMGLHG